MHLLFAAVLALTQQWLLVSDLHVNPFAGGAQPSAYKSDTNWTLFDSTVSAMRRAAPDARVVIISGDFLAHKFAAKVAKANPRLSPATAALQTMSRIERTFAQAFPRAQFLIALGNNDDPCGDYRTAPGSPYLAALARIWAPAVNRGGVAPDFVAGFSRAGAYTARLPVRTLRAVVADDVYWSMFFRPCGRSAAGEPLAQNERFANALGATPAGTRDVVIVHIPPGVDPTSTLIAHRLVIVPYLSGRMQTRFLSALSAHARSVSFTIAGHMHRSGFRLPGGVPMLISPSISPIYDNNPAFVRLQMAPDGTLADYQLFAYSETQGGWSQSFDFDRAYGVNGFTATALGNAHRKIGEDPAVRQRWAASMVGGARNAADILAAWRAYWCAQTDFGSSYAACAGDRRRAAVLPALLAVVGILIVLAIVWAVLRLARQRRAR